MGKNFRETLNERMQDPAFRTEWDAQEPERQIMRAIVEGREENGMTQKQLSDITGITQADISRLESGIPTSTSFLMSWPHDTRR